jgi:LCP family protein required for cell wall assembly
MSSSSAVHPSAGRKLAAVLSALALLLTAGCWVGWTAVNGVEGNLAVDKSADHVLAPAGSAENILVIGSDTRTGQGNQYGSTADSSGNGQSDTAFILHLSADRKSAFAVSLPRDSWVTRPGCKADGTTDGTMVTGKFNAAFAAGGSGCVVSTVTYLTGVPINHFVEVKLQGFKTIVNALGGVTICTTQALSDPVRSDGHGGMEGSGLSLPKGTSHIDGDQALDLVRARHIGDGSDLSRITRQQKFMSAMVRSVNSAGLLTDPVKLYQVLSAVAGSLTVDSGLSGDALKTFLLSMQGMTPSEIKFYTVPNKSRGDKQNVVWVKPGADAMFAAMKDDTQYPTKAAGAPTGQPVLTVAPSDTQVEVLNGSGIKGLARTAANQLTKLGYTVTTVGNAPTSTNATSSITYDPTWNVSAQTLIWAAGSPTSTAVTGQGKTLILTIGKNWTTARAAKITSAVAGTAASDVSCLS